MGLITPRNRSLGGLCTAATAVFTVFTVQCIYGVYGVVVIDSITSTRDPMLMLISDQLLLDA
jgi:hypothetical protein